MGLFQRVRLGGDSQPLPPIFADGLKHPESRLAGCRVLAHEAVFDETVQGIKQVDRRGPLRADDGFGILQVPTTDKDRQLPEHQLFPWLEQVVAPVDGPPKRPLSIGPVRRGRGEEVE